MNTTPIQLVSPWIAFGSPLGLPVLEYRALPKSVATPDFWVVFCECARQYTHTWNRAPTKRIKKSDNGADYSICRFACRAVHGEHRQVARFRISSSLSQALLLLIPTISAKRDSRVAWERATEPVLGLQTGQIAWTEGAAARDQPQPGPLAGV